MLLVSSSRIITVCESVDSTESVAFVVVPFPAQGHLNQLMHLSLLVASRGLPVH
jgi:cis-zeatin O-glucosyltransferase